MSNYRFCLLVLMATTLTRAQQPSPTGSAGASNPAPHKHILPPKPGVTTPGIRISLSKLHPEAIIPIPGSPDWIAIGDDVWVSNKPKSNVTRIDSKSNAVKQVIADLPGACSGLAIGFGSLWVPTCGDHSLARVDLQSGAVTIRIPTGVADSEGGIATGAGSVWMLTDGRSTLARVSPKTNKIEATTALPAGCFSASFGFDAVWVTCTKADTVIRVDPSNNKLVATIPVGPQPRFLTTGEGAVWTLNQGDGSVTRIDPAQNKVAATVQVGIPGPGGDISAGDGYVWATSFGLPIARIDPKTNQVTQQFIGEGGDAIRAGNGSLWLSNYKAATEWHIDPKKLAALHP